MLITLQTWNPVYRIKPEICYRDLSMNINKQGR